jgi:hypothetical protein
MGSQTALGCDGRPPASTFLGWLEKNENACDSFGNIAEVTGLGDFIVADHA